MSPMPIREAVRRLDGAGLVENIPHRGARVTELSITDLAEVYEARLALEVLAIRRAAERFDGPHEAIAAARLDNLQGMSDDNSARTSAAHEAFHFALYDAAASAWLTRLIRPVWETSERYCLETPQCRQLATRGNEHRGILDACATNDPDRAALALHDHLARTANNISVAMGGESLFELGGRNGRSNGEWNRFEELSVTDRGRRCGCRAAGRRGRGVRLRPRPPQRDRRRRRRWPGSTSEA